MANKMTRVIRRRHVREAPSTTTSINPKHIFDGHDDTIWSLVFLHDKVHIVSGSWDGMIRKWDCKTGQPVGEPWKGEKSILSLALSPNGQIIACGRKDGSVQLWDTNGQLIPKDNWIGHEDWVRSLSWSPSGSHLASGSFDGTIIVRSVENGRVQGDPIKANQGWVRSVAYSPSGDRIASSGDTICIWGSQTGKLLVDPINNLKRAATCVVWSSDGSKLYSTYHNLLVVFDSNTGTQLHSHEHNFLLFSIALSPKHNLLACVGEGCTAQLWSTSTEPFQRVYDTLARKEARNELHCVSFSPDGRYLAYGGYDNKITLWMVEDITNLPVTASSTNLQDDTPKPLSSLNDDDTKNTLEQSAVDDLHQRDNQYGDFFESSLSPLPSPSSDSYHRCYFSYHPKRLRERELMRQKFPSRGIFRRRDLSNPPPTKSKQPEPTLNATSGVVNQDERRRSVDSFEVVDTPRSTQHGNNKSGRRGEPTTHVQTHTPHSPLSHGFHSQDIYLLGFLEPLFTSRGNKANQTRAGVTGDTHTDDSLISDFITFFKLFSCNYSTEEYQPPA